ncbi:MAG: cation:proton antiporter [Thermoplasmata archaeon]|nr:cation:proton antiporter [Thermoplasmata archaeon]
MILPNVFIWIIVGGVGAAIFFALTRAFIGPTIPDRIAAIDNMTTVVASLLLIVALLFESSIYIDVALVYAILSFIGVIVFARYLEGGP